MDTPRPLPKKDTHNQSINQKSNPHPINQSKRNLRPTKCPNAYNSAVHTTFERTESMKPVRRDPN